MHNLRLHLSRPNWNTLWYSLRCTRLTKFLIWFMKRLAVADYKRAFSKQHNTQKIKWIHCMRCHSQYYIVKNRWNTFSAFTRKETCQVFLTWSSCLAASAPAREENVTKPTGCNKKKRTHKIFQHLSLSAMFNIYLYLQQSLKTVLYIFSFSHATSVFV